MKVVVVGAGAFGGWSALRLREKGVNVTLIDAWPPGHARGSSGGETRIIRMAYGDKPLYSEWAWQALQQWMQRQTKWDIRLFYSRPILWIGAPDEKHLILSQRRLEQLDLPWRLLSARKIASQFPWFEVADDEVALMEEVSGILMARRATRQVFRAFRLMDGDFEMGRVRPPRDSGDGLGQVALFDGRQIAGDQFLFACGAWLPELFPDLLREVVSPTLQEVFFIGLDSAHPIDLTAGAPSWYDFTHGCFYGVPPLEGKGLKIASDLDGPIIDPTSLSRIPTADGAQAVLRYLEHRFPGLGQKTILEARVCQYASSPDRHLILGRHPRLKNVWIAGGGSGHGFKLGPVVGEKMASLIAGEGVDLPPEVNLERLSNR